MSIVITFLIIVWLLSIMRSILFWLNFIQLKQYRTDRLFWELKSKSFYKLIFSSYRYILIILFVGLYLGISTTIYKSPRPLQWFIIIITLYFLINVILAAKNYLAKSLQLPKFTSKIIVLFLILIIAELAVASTMNFRPSLMVLIEIIQPAIVLLLFFILYSPNLILHKRLKARAAAKRSTFSDLIVIGITGSYGKTTMKEYLSHILSKKFKVLKTPDHVNVDTGIAKLVVDKLSTTHQVFIVEMGAYKIGEIKSICDIVRPTHAVMTGLSNQHVELFGSVENIRKAKFELVNAVENDAQIFANKESQELVAAFTDRQPKWFGHKQTTAVFGRANRINLNGAIKVAKSLGMTDQEIKDALKDLPSIEGTMQQIEGLNGSSFIDDSYNANTEGVLAALDDLKASKLAKRIVVFKEIIELGEQAEADHIKIADKIGECATMVMLLPGRYRDEMKKHLIAHGVEEGEILTEVDDLRALLDKDAVVLFEGRGSEGIMKKL